MSDSYGGYDVGYGGDNGGVSLVLPIKVEVDWDNSGDFNGENDNVTKLVRGSVSPLAVQYGRDQSTALAPTISGSGSMTLDNQDRRFSPRNLASPLQGKVRPARPVRIMRTFGGFDYTLFQGYTDDAPLNPDLNSRAVSVTLVDALAMLRGQTISTELYRGIRTGEAIGLILDACGWTRGRDLDSGATVIPWWWEDETEGLAAIEKVLRSEGPPALFTVDADGGVIFRDRHHRITRDRSLNSQGVWRGTDGAEPVMQTPFTYDEGWRGIVNTGTVSVDLRTPRALQVVWSSEDTISLQPGETEIITATSSDPFYGAVTPELDIDFTTLKGSVDVELLRTSGASAGISLTALGAAAIIDGLQLRAHPVSVANTRQVSASDPTSVAQYGSRSFSGDLPWCSAGDAQAVLSTVVAQRANPLPILSVRFVVGRNLARGNAVLGRDLGDRVTVLEAETALADDFYVESIQHDLTGEEDHSVTFGLEAAPVAPGNILRFDSTGFGAAFGSGVDEVQTVFRFDGDLGHRFDQSVFAT